MNIHSGMTAYRIFDDILAVYCESAPLGDHIDCFLNSLAAPDDRLQEASVRLAILEGPPGKVAMCSPEVSLASVEQLEYDAWIRFRRLFLHLVVYGDRPYYPLHAAAIADEHGRAALLVGAEGAGKTSLLTALLKRGLHFVTDDFAMLHLQDASIASLPTGVTAEEGYFQFFPDLQERRRDTCRFHCQNQWQWTLDLSEVFIAVPPFKRLQISHVFFIRPNFGGRSRMAKCDLDEALWWFQISRHENPWIPVPLRQRRVKYQTQCLRLAQMLFGRAKYTWVANGNLEDAADIVAAEFGA